MDNSTAILPVPQTVSYHPSANAILLPLFSILISLLLITPFRLLLRVHNIPTTSLIGVIWLSLLFITINSIVWPTEDLSNRFSGHILCDIEVLLRQALYTTMASTTCCITKFLASALDTDNACLYESRAMKRRRVLKDCLFCFAVPVYGVDCLWVCGFDGSELVLVIRRLHKHRSNLSSTLSRSSSTTSLSPRRFLKLFLMSLTLLIIYFPILIYYFYLNISYPFHAYSFSFVHDPLYWPVIVFWQTADAPKGMQYDAWCWVAMGFLVCCFWGWNEEAGELWRGWLVKFGMSRCWPSLRLTARERRERGSSRSRGSTASWVDNFDLVGRTLSYFESREVARKASFATSTTLDGGDMTQTRTQSHSSHGESSSSAGKPSLKDDKHDLSSNESSFCSTASVSRSQTDLEVITPLPTASIARATTTPHPPPTTTTTTPSRPIPIPLFSSFRTHLNPLFSSSTSTSTSTSSSSAAKAKQSLRHHNPDQSQGSSNPAHDHITTISTTISAQHHYKSSSTSHPHAHAHPRSRPDSYTNLQDLDAEAPKPGTRAYRERERREMVAEKERLKGEDGEKEEKGDWDNKGKGKAQEKDAAGLRIEQEVRFGVE
ncbi:a-pheromone receptor protein [Rutstroemia sp. NJR-2017a BBW]|nr:a-pheromone receptor protein [Rutstroemia sp. NJR-2017a BBW]